MEIRQLTYFAAIVEEGNISKAAERLHLSQPPLTRQLQLLETELGCSLFERDTRHMVLTEAGELLYEKAREVIRQCGDIRREVADISSGRKGTAHIGVVSSVSSRLLPVWIMRFHSLYPNVRIDLTERDSYEILESVRNQKTDIAIVRRPFAGNDLEIFPISTEPMCAVGKREMFEGLPEGRLSLKHLVGKPVIIYHRWENILKDEAALNPICRCEEAGTTAALSEAGLGIGIIPLSAVPCKSENTEVREIANSSLQSEICALKLKGRYTPAAAELFLDMLCSQKLNQK